MTKTWTKASEIEWLEKAITDLGPNSYLGPWLKDAAIGIAADIRQDYPINALMPNEARKIAAGMLTAAKAERDDIIGRANEQAKAHIERAENRVREHLEAARQELHRIANRL